ncbi:MAG: formylglycine-generating enzyme family protein, partial [Chloroflexota bacterium]
GRAIASVRSTDVFETYDVSLDGFWMDKYEITIAQYDQFMMPDCFAQECSESFLPKEVTWLEAVELCAFRNARLPSEEEWEYAASGSSGYIFPWGNDLDPELLENDSYTEFDLYDVGTKEINVSWAGIYDMVGNAAEWTDDIFQPYSDDTDLDAWHTVWTEYERVLRGGSASNSITEKTTYSRQGAWYNTAGVRCVRTTSPAS